MDDVFWVKIFGAVAFLGILIFLAYKTDLKRRRNIQLWFWYSAVLTIVYCIIWLGIYLIRKVSDFFQVLS
jgi:hypothetical protein